MEDALAPDRREKHPLEFGKFIANIQEYTILFCIETYIINF